MHLQYDPSLSRVHAGQPHRREFNGPDHVNLLVSCVDDRLGCGKTDREHRACHFAINPIGNIKPDMVKISTCVKKRGKEGVSNVVVRGKER